MKRIALIRNSYSYDFGGAEIFPIQLARQLAGLDCQPVVLSSNRTTLAKASKAGIQAAHSPWWSLQNISGKRLLLFPLYLLWLVFVAAWYVYYFLVHRIDIVHPQSRDDFIAATLAGRLLGKRVIWSDHADLKAIYMNHPVWHKNPVGKLVYAASRLAHHVTIESHSEQKLLEQSLGKPLPANYSVIYLGVIDQYQPIKKTSSKLVLISTSRLVADKGIAELIQAFTALKPANAVLQICGDGPESDRFRTLAEGAANIEFLGHVDNVTDRLQYADIFVHPTYHEGFGLSLVEAEMCALPIVATNVGSIPEIVQNGVSGILVNPQDANALAAAIQKLLNDPDLRAAMGKAGRQIYLQSFQFDQIVQNQLVPLYQD